MLEGRRLSRAVITACVFALLSGLTRAVLVPASMAALRSLLALAGVLLSALTKRESLLFLLLDSRGVGSAILRARVFALPSSSTRT